MARLLVQTGLPHSRRDSLSFVRTNGSLQVSISAHPLLGLPYGRYPRLLMAWVTTEAVRTKEPVPVDLVWTAALAGSLAGLAAFGRPSRVSSP